MSGRSPRWVRGVLVLVAVSIGAAQAPADEDLGTRITAGDLASAAKSLQDESFAEQLRGNSAKLRSAAEAAVARAGMSGQRTEFTAIVDFLLKSGEAAATANASDADAWWTIAEARSAKAIDAASAASKPPAEAWFAVAEAFDKAACAAPPGDEARRCCMRRMLEGAGNVSNQGNVVVARALGIAQKALKDAGPAPELRLAYATTIYDAMQVLVQSDRSGAREAVKAGHAVLRPVHAEEKTPADAAGLWNRFVTFDRKCKFAVGEKYITERLNFLEGNYTIDVPIGTIWKPEGGVTGSQQGDWGQKKDPTRIVRSDAGGTRVAWLQGSIYGFGWVYRNNDTRNPIGADNPGGIADLGVLRYRSSFFKNLDKLKKPKKGKVGHAIPAFSYQLDGTGNSDKPLRVLGWVFRGRALQSYELVYVDEMPSDDADPELDALMDSVRSVD